MIAVDGPGEADIQTRVADLEDAVKDLVGSGAAPAAVGKPETPEATSEDRGTPAPGDPTPTVWRGMASSDQLILLADLGQWVDWMICAFAVDDDRMAHWWMVTGAVEELLALRQWHHEIVDVDSAATPKGEQGEDTDPAAHARDLVSWHDALSRVLARLVGVPHELLQRDRGSEAQTQLREQRRRSRVADFAQYIASVEAQGFIPADGRSGDRPVSTVTG